MYTNNITSATQAVEGLNNVSQSDVTASPSTNLIDSMSGNINNNFNDLLGQQLNIMSLTSTLQDTSKVNTSTLGELQSAVDEYAIATQVTSKICSSVVKSINELTHIQ
jgi:methyl-accepting chemotaxis protein